MIEASTQSLTTRTELNRYLLLVGVGYFAIHVADFQNGMPKLPLQFMLKDELHLTASQLALFVTVSSFAWYLKPIAGILTDTVRVFGTRRRYYLLLSSAAAALIWALLSVAPHEYFLLLSACSCLSVALVIFQTTLGGVLVEVGKRLNATGRLSSQRSIALGASSVFEGPLGGFLATRSFSLVSGLCASIIGLLGWLFFRSFREDVEQIGKDDLKANLREELKALLYAVPTWIAIALWCLVVFSPGFQTPLFYYQTDTLKFSVQFIGWLKCVAGGCALLGGLTYRALCGKLPLRILLITGFLFHITHVALYFGYHSQAAALWIEGVASFVDVLAFLPILDLVARATPVRAAALGYALLFSLGNFSTRISDVVGSWAYDRFGLTFTDLLWANMGTTMLVFLFLPFIPSTLLQGRDGQESAIPKPRPPRNLFT